VGHDGPLTDSACVYRVHVQDNEIVKVTSPHDNPVTHGNLCIKGRFG
jgi:predicted molibdopterin-dependent oxidoreductase YjgC